MTSSWGEMFESTGNGEAHLSEGEKRKKQLVSKRDAGVVLSKVNSKLEKRTAAERLRDNRTSGEDVKDARRDGIQMTWRNMSLRVAMGRTATRIRNFRRRHLEPKVD